MKPALRKTISKRIVVAIREKITSSSFFLTDVWGMMAFILMVWGEDVNIVYQKKYHWVIVKGFKLPYNTRNDEVKKFLAGPVSHCPSYYPFSKHTGRLISNSVLEGYRVTDFPYSFRHDCWFCLWTFSL